MKKQLIHSLALIVILSFLVQPVPTLANSDQVKIPDSSFTSVAQTPTPLGPDNESEDQHLHIEIEAEKRGILEEYLRKEVLPEELMSHENESNLQEKREYVPPSDEIIAQTKAQVNSFSCADVTDVPQIECEALVALYASTNGAGWDNNSNWLVSNTVSEWYGITIYAGYIFEINLYNNNLIGSIPPELGNLSNLRKLYLDSNQLSGSIPVALGNLSNLECLFLGINQLNGNIPPKLGNLNNLWYLFLNNNQLSGSIPPELGNLSNLRRLILDKNQLSGSIPPKLGNLSNLWYLSLSENQLSGSIPSALGNLSNLQYMYLSSNQLSGSIPLSFTNLTSLDDFFFFNTYLCEPSAPEFLTWKATVLEWVGTNLICTNEPELKISHVEWTQSVQDHDNSVPLIAGKDTLVRVFVQSNNNVPIRSLSGTIVARKDGIVLDGSPMSWIKKDTFSGTLNFVLPKTWTTAGALELTINIVNSSSIVKNLSFITSPGIKIVYIPIEYDDNTVDPIKMSKAISWLRDAYPNSNIIYNPGLFSMLFFPNFDCDKFIVDREVIACRALDLLNKLSRTYNLLYKDDYDFIIGWLPDEAKSVFTTISGYTINGISNPLWNNGDGKSVWYGEWSTMGTGIAHELGHNLDQRHSNSANCNPKDIDPNTDWPWPDSSYIHDFGWRTGTQTFYAPYQYFDIMSYCDPQWISTHTYKEIFNYWVEFKEPQVLAQYNEDSLLVISGLVFADDEATMDPVWERQISTPWVNPPVGTEYCVELIDSFDTVINQYCFNLDFFDYETQQTVSTDSYFILLPDSPNLSRVELKKGNLLLASRIVSFNTPQVELTSPNGGEDWGPTGFETIAWVGNDSDEDPLFYNVYYSPDNGVSWKPLAIDLETTYLNVDTGMIPGSSNAKIRVSVSDGVHSVFDESDSTFIVEPKGPQVSILLDNGHKNFLASTFVTLNGTGIDLEDGQLEGENLCWTSDLDDNLGCGDSITPFLSVGTHSITLRGIDSDGNIAVSTETINIVECFDIDAYTTPISAGKIIIDIPTNCSADSELYAKDTVINLNIEPNRGFSFIEWSGDINGIDVPKTILVDRDLLINGIFEQTEFFINLPLILR